MPKCHFLKKDKYSKLLVDSNESSLERKFLLFDRSLFFVAVSMYSYEGYSISPFSSSPLFFGGGHEIDEQNHSKNHEWFSFVFHPSIQTGEKTSTEAPKSTPFEAEVVLASDSEDGRWGVSVRYDSLENSWVFGCSFLKGFNPLLGP